jgi:hypothetical protein
MPIISKQYKFIFICAPATGSSAVSKAFLDYKMGEWYPKQDIKNSEGKILVDFKHGTLKELKKYGLLSATEELYFKFVGVRNPFGFFVADYVRWRDKWSKWPDDSSKPRWVLRPGPQRNIQLATHYDFPDWLQIKLKGKKPGNFLNYWTEGTDFFIRQEHLQEDFEQVKQTLNLPTNLSVPLYNQTEERNQEKHYMEFYTPETRKLVEHLYGEWMLKNGYQ